MTDIYFVFSLFFSILWGNGSQAPWAQPVLSDIHASYADTLHHKGGAPPLTRILKTRHPGQTKCPTRRTTPALALFTQILIGPPAWEWTSKNGFSWSLWITFYSSSFPTVLAREKAREICNGDKMWGISRWILDSPTSLRKWAAVLAVKWLPAWDGLVRLTLNFWNPDKVSGHSLWKAQVGFTLLPFTDHKCFNNLCPGKEEHFREN